MFKAVSIVLLILSAAGSAYAQQQCGVSTTGRTITVYGEGTVRLVPDRAVFTVGVETELANVADAFKQNTAKVNAVIAMLKQHGVKPQEIQTSMFEISSRDVEAKKRYRVRNQVTVTREDLSTVGELLQAAVENGANEGGGLQFVAANRKDAVLRALDLAFQDARVKADRLATLSGRTLGEIVCMSEEESAPSLLSSVAETVAVTAPSIESGVQSLAFRVGAIFEVK